MQTDTVAYVNCCFKHALLFGNEFHLITEADIAPIAVSLSISTTLSLETKTGVKNRTKTRANQCLMI